MTVSASISLHLGHRGRDCRLHSSPFPWLFKTGAGRHFEGRRTRTTGKMTRAAWLGIQRLAIFFRVTHCPCLGVHFSRGDCCISLASLAEFGATLMSRGRHPLGKGHRRSLPITRAVQAGQDDVAKTPLVLIYLHWSCP